MRVCVVTDHASYKFGGEAVLPIHYFAGLRKRGIEAWLVVHARTRTELESAFPDDRDRMRFIDDAWFHKLLSRINPYLPARIAGATVALLNLLITQYLARRIVRELIVQELIDIVHQPIPISPRFPSLMTDLGVPVVIGPMNGGMEYPPAFREMESIFSRTAIRFGRWLSDFVNARLPGKLLADVLLVANERTWLALPPGVQGRVIKVTENGVNLEIWNSVRKFAADAGRLDDQSRGATFVFVGRLVDWKALDIVIDAMRLVPDARLTVVGDGPMRQSWQQAAERLGVAHRINFTGFLAPVDFAPHLHASLALVLPSIYEAGGAVVLEAMACAIPVIATKWGGPVDYLDGSCGFLVEPSSRQAMVKSFAEAMQRLIAEPQLRDQMGANGLARVEQNFNWERKIDRIIEIYREIYRSPSLDGAGGRVRHLA